jgi:hypothetical protein
MAVEDKIIEIITYTLPALITAGVVFVMLQKFFNNEENKRKFELLRENQKQSLPIRLQAYERLVLFLERINPANLTMRVEPTSLDAPSYATLLIHNILTEYEHNLTQQIYVTADCWDFIAKAKNSTIAQIRNASVNSNLKTGEDLRLHVLNEISTTESASAVAISYIKEELKKVF